MAGASRLFFPPDPTMGPSNLYNAKPNRYGIPGSCFVHARNPTEMLMFDIRRQKLLKEVMLYFKLYLDYLYL